MNIDKLQYRNHKHRAARNGVPFHLTFEVWYDFWQQSGHYHERGPGIGQYCMSRFGDKGAYEIGNVFIQLSSKNSSDGSIGKKASEAARMKNRISNIDTNRKVSCVLCRKETTYPALGQWHKVCNSK